MTRSLIRTVLTLIITTIILAADPPPPAVIEVKGEIVDLHCHLTRGASGEAHAGCAAACISRGVPAALKTEDGKLVLLLDLERNSVGDKLEGRIGKPVIVKGTALERAGMRAIQVIEVSEP